MFGEKFHCITNQPSRTRELCRDPSHSAENHSNRTIIHNAATLVVVIIVSASVVATAARGAVVLVVSSSSALGLALLNHALILEDAASLLHQFAGSGVALLAARIVVVA